MGPRLVSRGKFQYLRIVEHLTVASMGPRLVSRGKEQLVGFRLDHDGGFNGAATC